MREQVHENNTNLVQKYISSESLYNRHKTDSTPIKQQIDLLDRYVWEETNSRPKQLLEISWACTGSCQVYTETLWLFS